MMFAAKDAQILVVDDNPNNLKLLVGMLGKIGYKTRAAIDGETALISVENNPPDLILLDINMPEMTGYQVAERLKNQPEQADIPIIFISALNDTESILKAFQYGGVDYISKPFQFEEVAARVQTHLTLHFQRQQLIHFNKRDKKRLEEIRASEARYRDLFDNASDMIQSVDAEGQFLYANRLWHELLGYSETELYTMNFIQILHPSEHEKCIRIFEDILQTPNEHRRIETIFVTKDGEEIIVQGNISSQYDPKYGVHTRGIFRDITQQRQTEKQAIQFTLERQRGKLLSDFIRDSSHELRTPLTVIAQQLYLIKRLSKEEKQLGKIALAERKVGELNMIIEQLYDFVKLSELLSPKFDKVNLPELLRDTVTEFGGSQASITLEIDPQLDYIEADHSLLRKAIRELISNAQHYTSDGGHILVIASQVDEEFFRIMIEDDGVGIDIEAQDKIFDPLYKVDEARTAGTSGVGLGLSIVQRIMELHDGIVEVRSGINQGSRFTLGLPISNRVLA